MCHKNVHQIIMAKYMYRYSEHDKPNVVLFVALPNGKLFLACLLSKPCFECISYYKCTENKGFFG